MQDPENINFFGQLMAVLDEEQLIRIRRRFEMQNNSVMAEVMTDELEERHERQSRRPVSRA